MKKTVTNDRKPGEDLEIRTIRRKRIKAISAFETPRKIRNGGNRRRSSSLEALPEDILIRILCCVDHDDLKQLFQVSKSIKEASLVEKRDHFAFSTPSKRGLRGLTDLELDGEEAPNAPKQHRSCYRSRIDGKKIADISVNLFGSPPEKQWRNLSLQF